MWRNRINCPVPLALIAAVGGVDACQDAGTLARGYCAFRAGAPMQKDVHSAMISCLSVSQGSRCRRSSPPPPWPSRRPTSCC
eukprot:747937-Prymnesium_polylepis.4